MTMTDDWGRLVVTGEALMNDWKLSMCPHHHLREHKFYQGGWLATATQPGLENCTGRESRRLQNHESDFEC